jgi:3-dehydro-L-gulonate 2-dehydrogenase
MLKVTFEELKGELQRVLLGLGFEAERAELCARLFAETTRDGVYSHGLNRFPRFVEQIRKGVVKIHARPVLVQAIGAIERWDGKNGPGNLNAHASMARAIELARQHGVGCVALANTNHWMRGGSYGWQAVEADTIGICWTNTMANLPPWGAREPRIGNNPLIIAVPHADGPVVLDMAMSQFSFGALEGYRLRGAQLPVDGGFDQNGQLTRDPGAIEASQRALPIGYWKGSGLSMMLDMLGALLSGGSATHQIEVNVINETNMSQVFLVFNLPAIDKEGRREELIRGVVGSVRGVGKPDVLRTPGERVLQARQENLASGIPVEERVWSLVKGM